MPAELVQKIAWAIEPVRLTFNACEQRKSDQTVRSNGQRLFHLAITNRQTFRLLRPLLHSARLTVALAQIWDVYTSTMPVRALLPDPTAALDIYTGPAFMPAEHQNMTYKQLHERQLDTLLRDVLEILTHQTRSAADKPHGLSEESSKNWDFHLERSMRSEKLLTHLFDAWCARLPEDVTASAHVPHLTLDDLPLRLFRCGYGSSSLDPEFLRHAAGHTDDLEVSTASVQVKLLLQHLARMNEALKLFVCLHLDLLLADANEDKVTMLKKYADDEILITVERWRSGFFMNLDEGEKPHEDVVMEVWEGLQRMPLLGAAVPLFMIIKFACMPSRDESITNEQLVQLLHRAMSEMIEMVPGVAHNRVDYVVLRAPVEIGVAAFKRLTPDQREQFLYTGSYGHGVFQEAYQAYLEAPPLH